MKCVLEQIRGGGFYLQHFKYLQGGDDNPLQGFRFRVEFDRGAQGFPSFPLSHMGDTASIPCANSRKRPPQNVNTISDLLLVWEILWKDCEPERDDATFVYLGGKERQRQKHPKEKRT